MIFLCAAIACVLGGDIDFIDGFDDGLSPNKTEVRQDFEYLRAGFNCRISQIVALSGITDVNIIMEYRRKWFNSIVTVIFSSTSYVVANTYDGRIDYKKREMSSDEIEKVKAFLDSKWAYRYGSSRKVYDMTLIYTFYVEEGRVVSVQCYEQPIFSTTSKRNPRDRGTFASTNDLLRAGHEMTGDVLSAMAYNKFVDVVRIFSPLLSELQRDIRTQRKYIDHVQE